MRYLKVISLIMVLGALGSCESGSNAIGMDSQTLRVVNAFPNLQFDSPVFLGASNDGSDRIFVLEQAGVIRVLPNDRDAMKSDIFLDIRDRVRAGGERGLLGLALHPDFARNGLFYVYYTSTRNGNLQTIVARFLAMDGVADASTELNLLTVDQPFGNHNGGMIAFGPDGYLYIALGDGGSGGDPLNHGQNRRTLLGSILRIDVDRPSNGLTYGVPSDNPFVGEGGGVRTEIFAYGLRNPWRFSIDRPTGQIWAGDVGQNSREEVDLIEPGGNYGWRTMEGFDCFDPPNRCNTSGLRLPVVDYGHSEGCSVTGGYVYRGNAVPHLRGAYVYGDYCSGRIWMLRAGNDRPPANTLLINTRLSIASFGLDEQGELYIVDHGGSIFRLSQAVQ